jgi:hypothetical protein
MARDVSRAAELPSPPPPIKESAYTSVCNLKLSGGENLNLILKLKQNLHLDIKLMIILLSYTVLYLKLIYCFLRNGLLLDKATIFLFFLPISPHKKEMVQDGERIPLIRPSTVIDSSSVNILTFSWSHISTEVKNDFSRYLLPTSIYTFTNQHTEQQPRRLLDDLTGIARAGEILAIMGTSGVGKGIWNSSRKSPFCVLKK